MTPLHHASLRPLALAAAALLSASLPAQESTARAAPKRFGTVLKGDVDGIVSSLRQAGNRHEVGGVRDTAKFLTALGHCHRFYSQQDGPVVRTPIQTVFSGRRGDGSFAGEGDDTPAAIAATTAWCAEALQVLEPELYAPEVEQANKWLRQHDHAGRGPWQARLNSVRQAFARGEGDPTALGKRAMKAVDMTASPVAIDVLVTLVACQVVAREHDQSLEAGQNATWTETQQKGFEFLLGQQENGVFFIATPAGKFPDPGLSALGLAALQTKPAARRSAAEQQIIDQGLQALAAQQNDDGSFAERNANYTTCAAVLALAAAERPEFRPLLQKAQKYLLGIQNIENRGYARADRDYGSVGYGGDQRGDLSNLQFAVQALRESGVDAQHESLQKALVFLQRTQNLKKFNDFEGRVRNEGEWQEVVSGDDGGSAYYPGNSAAGYVDLPGGKQIPRSYGSMTYALLKCYILAGLPADDARVQAAVRWVAKNWTLDENPGAAPSLGEKAKYQGLFYYYMVMAQALQTAGIDQLEVPAAEGESVKIDWRSDLKTHLAELQNDDGSWMNDRNGRWWEDKAAICTIYSMLALQKCE